MIVRVRAVQALDSSQESAAMRRNRLEREVQRVVKRVLPLVPTNRKVVKAEFEAIHAEVLACVQEKTGASVEQLSQVTAKVLSDLPNEYGRLDESDRSWPALIAYLYSKYLRELRAAR
jgi:hypothetical protein